MMHCNWFRCRLEVWRTYIGKSRLKVVLLEAGPYYDPRWIPHNLRMPGNLPLEGVRTKYRPFGDFDGCYWGWRSMENHTGKGQTGSGGVRECWRARTTGEGYRRWVWPKDFKHMDVDGLGENWPIGYEDVKPYYDAIDRLPAGFAPILTCLTEL